MVELHFKRSFDDIHADFCLSAIFSILEELWIFCTTLFGDCLAHLQIWDEVFCLLCKLTNFLHFLPIYTSSLEKIHNGKIPQWKKIFLKNVCFNQKKMQKSKTTFWPIGFTFYTMPKKKKRKPTLSIQHLTLRKNHFKPHLDV